MRSSQTKNGVPSTKYGRCLKTILVTYNSNLSKNARIANRFKGFYIKPEAKAAEKTLHHELTLALKRVKFYNNKVYLDIFVMKPRTNIDAINFIDAIADVLKDVIQVDDKWFSIKSLDWAVDTKNPYITIKLYQPVRKDA